MRTAVLINYSANYHTGKKKWLRIRDEVSSLLPENTLYIPYEIPFNTRDCLGKLTQDEGIRCIISAGGDGSINKVLNDLVEITGESSSEYCLGAIGLGSSNDFLKPVNKDIRGIPMKIHPDNRRLSDIGKVSFTDEKNELHSRYFIINASIGITADANQLFNQGDLFIRTMKSRFVGVTILYTALKTLATYKNKDVKIRENGKSQELRVANISITKSPYISGSFHYDCCPDRDSGKLGFHCSGDMTRWEIIKTLMDLSKGKYSGSAKRKTEYLEKIRISSDLSLALETDGEVQLGRDFTFSIIPKAIFLAS